MTSSAILAREIMAKNLVTLTPEMEVFAAIDILLKKRISGAPVVAADGSFLGVFSESSCMQFIVNAAYEKLPDAGLMAFVDRNPPTIAPDTDLLTICHTFVSQSTRRLPVLENGRLVGQISRRDIMRKVSELSKGKRCGHKEVLYLSALMEGVESESVAMRISQ